MNYIADDILMHYGVKRRSGRYPWGSGDNPYQHSGDFYSRVNELRKEGKSNSEIAKEMELTTTQLNAYYSIAKNEVRERQVARAKSLKSDGYNTSEIGRIMGKNESTIRSYLNEESTQRMMQARNTADFLRQQIDEKGVIDVGAGVEKELGISKEKLNEALEILDAEGYPVHGIGVRQLTNPNVQTTLKVVCPPGTTEKDVYDKRDAGDIHSVKDYYSKDGGDTFETFHYPSSLDSSRVQVRYREDGGASKDGVIELRRGVDDISLGSSNYAQVRIMVDGSHYIKGMAMYSDNMPPGVDVIFNTNKGKDTPMMGDKDDTVLKPISTKDPNNPFGSYIKANGQRNYIGPDGKEHLSPINKVREEGDWETWSRNLSSQMLSKQPISLIKKQLDLTYADNKSEFEDIKALTNPTVKRALLNDFANSCDSDAVYLQAASLPRQKAQVILPVTTLKDNEIYAQNFRNGEEVVLIRYPHGGTFEIPRLKVNNNHPDAKSILGNARDAVGINSHVAERLSGADFDGDTVVVIPVNDRVKIKTTDPLKGLEGFDPKTEYPKVDGMKVMGKKLKQMEMGKVSNLITDMTLKGATEDEIARAVRHSMVVIDAEKHELNYKKSYEDNHIAELKQKYQGHYTEDGRYSEAASTLISRARGKVAVPKRVGAPKPNPETGELEYREVKEYYINKQGKKVLRTIDSKQMYETKDPFTLSSGTPQEIEYAKYATKMKAMANEARKEAMATGNLKYSKEAKERYSEEVKTLDAKLKLAELNAPRERQAQIIATGKVNAIKADNPSVLEDKDQLKKIRNRELVSARASVGASGKKTKINITPEEWAAIQAGAIHDSKLRRILLKADSDKIREYATPRNNGKLSAVKQSKIKAMNNSGYSIAEIADRMGVSTSTVIKYM